MQGSDKYQFHNTHSLLKIFLETMVDVQCSGFLLEQLIQVKLKLLKRCSILQIIYNLQHSYLKRNTGLNLSQYY